MFDMSRSPVRSTEETRRVPRGFDVDVDVDVDVTPRDFTRHSSFLVS